MADLLGIGLSGLRTSQTSLTVTGHNISNVNTAGYSRQETVQSTRTPQYNGYGYIGSGSTVQDVRRLVSDFLTAQVRNNTVVASDVEAYKTQIDQLDSLLAGTVTGVSPGLESFFSALQAAVESPSDIPARQLVLSEAEGLAKRFNTVYERIDQQNQYINKQMASIADQVNRLASSVAGYNDAIATARANGAEPNDLLDAREETVRQLSELIGVQVTEQDGALNVFIGTGQPLVVGKQANSIAITPSTTDPTRTQVEFLSGGSRQVITSQVNGGELGGLLRYRDEVLDPTFNSLGRLALSISEQVNDQLGQGLDLAGNVGSALFKDINSADLQALRSYPTGANVAITDTSKLSTSDYKLDLTSVPPTARRLSDNATIAVTGTGTTADPYVIGDEGFTVSFPAGATATSYTIMPTRRGATSIAVALDQPEQLAFAASARAEANTQNRGTGAIGQPELIDGPSPIDTADLGRLFGTGGLSLSFDATTGTFDTSSLPAGATLSYVSPSTTGLTSGQSNTVRLDYTDTVTGNSYSYEFTVSGVPQAGDTFSLAYNQNGVSDNRNGLKLVDLQNKATVGVSYDTSGNPIANTGVSFSDGYGDLVERVGTLTAQARIDSEATTALLSQAQNNRDSLSAVNLDEEAAKLIQFEQYYNASAQVIQVARSVFDTLINAMG